MNNYENEQQRLYGQRNLSSPRANECVPKTRGEGTVTMEMAEMEKMLEAMTVEIDILSNKLAPIVIPVPAPEPGLRGNGPTGSDLAIELGRRNACLRDHLTRLELLNQGIDL